MLVSRRIHPRPCWFAHTALFLNGILILSPQNPLFLGDKGQRTLFWFANMTLYRLLPVHST